MDKLPSEQWDDLKKEILKKIDKIDKNTTWEPYEPDWWLEMMDVKETVMGIKK